MRDSSKHAGKRRRRIILHGLTSGAKAQEGLGELRPPLWQRALPAFADEEHALRLVGLALAGGTWLLGMVSPPREGLSGPYVAIFTALLATLALVDLSAPSRNAPMLRRIAWLVVELALAFLVVRAHGTLLRPSLVYLLPASRAFTMFEEKPGLALSASIWAAYALNVVATMGPERLYELPNYFSFLLTPYVLAVVFTIAVVRQAAGRRSVETLYGELQAAHTQLQRMHQQASELAVTQERNRLAREIHDSLAHYLTVINLQLEAAEKLGRDQTERAIEHVQRARSLAIDCLQDVRRSVGALRATSLEDLALPELLRKLTAEFTETGLRVSLDIQLPPEVRVGPDPTLVLFRAAQEGLTNVQRHARATEATITLSHRDSSLELIVEDNGIGPPTNGTNGTRGFGIAGLQERVDLVGGRLTFGRAERGGARLAVSVPSSRA